MLTHGPLVSDHPLPSSPPPKSEHIMNLRGTQMTPLALITLSLLYKHTQAFITLCAHPHTHSEKTAASRLSLHVNASAEVFFFCQTCHGCIPAHSAHLLLRQSDFFLCCGLSWRPGCGVFGLWRLCLILPDGVVLAGCGCDIIARPRLPRLALHIPSASLPAKHPRPKASSFFFFF